MDFSIALKNGQKLRGLFSVPPGEPSAMIILVHGVGEHINRYSHLAAAFLKEGIGFMGVDLPGHGRSEGKRGHISDYSVYRELIGTLIDISEKTYVGVPVFLYGHSLGGGIALNYLIHEKRKIQGSIITSPWLRLSFEPNRIKRAIAAIMKRILPGLVQPTGLDVNHLSHDREVVENYVKDPLVHNKISVSLFHETISSAENSLAKAATLDLPVLIMHGSVDQITSPDASIEFAGNNPKIEIKIWEGGFHELHNETFKEDVFAYTINWIKNHL